MRITFNEVQNNDIKPIKIDINNFPTFSFHASTSIFDAFDKISKQTDVIIKHECTTIGTRCITYTIKDDLEIVANAKNGAFFNTILDFTKDFVNYKTIFMGDVDLKCHFVQDIYLKNCEFRRNFNATNINFQGNIYFNNSIFKGYVDFHESKFNQTACFYGVTFKELPNFSACYFKEPKNVNLINVNISNFDFKKVENYIENNFNDEQCKVEISQNEIQQCKIEQRYRLKCAKDIKDSFRTIKDVLVEQNNILEAQEWHTLELYAKEKEIEFGLKIFVKNAKSNEKSNNTDKRKIKKNPPKKTLKILFNGNKQSNITKFIKYKLTRLNHSFKNMINMTTWISCVLLHIYRNTSDHHTNILRILNWTICMIVVYSILNFMLIKSEGFVQYSHITLIISFVAFLVVIGFLLRFGGKMDNFSQHSSTNIFMIFLPLLIIMGITMFITHQIFFFMLYLISVIVCYYLFICRLNIVVFSLRFFVYIVFIFVLFLKPQLINPFVGIFSYDKLIESQLEKKLDKLDSNTIMNLSKISQKQFALQYNEKNISLTESNIAKTIIMANKAELDNIISFLFDKKKINDFKKILTTLNDNPIELPNIIKSIDNKNNNNAIFYDMTKLLNSDFVGSNITYEFLKDFSTISVKLKDEDYQIFKLKENQTYLKNILSLIDLDNEIHLQEIKKAIDYDNIINGAIKSTSIIYSIILLLCIFSLQKTARKNSIIPS